MNGSFPHGFMYPYLLLPSIRTYSVPQSHFIGTITLYPSFNTFTLYPKPKYLTILSGKSLTVHCQLLQATWCFMAGSKLTGHHRNHAIWPLSLSCIPHERKKTELQPMRMSFSSKFTEISNFCSRTLQLVLWWWWRSMTSCLFDVLEAASAVCSSI